MKNVLFFPQLCLTTEIMYCLQYDFYIEISIFTLKNKITEKFKLLNIL